MIRYIFALVSAVVIMGMIVLVVILPKPQVQEVASNSVLITDVTIFDGIAFNKQQDIRIVDGVITEVGRNIPVNPAERKISGEGLTALPGLIDAHTHSYGNGLSDALRFGVSAHLDMFTSESELLDTRNVRETLNLTDKTDLFSSGTLATVEGGHGTQYGFAIDTIGSIDEIESWISARKSAGVDYIKLVYMPNQPAIPSLDLETATAVIEQAHIAGFKVYAHISKQSAAIEIVEAGIDGLVHVFADSHVSDEFVATAKANNIVVIPTLAVIASVDNQQQNLSLAENPLVERYLSAEQRSSLMAKFAFNAPGFSLEIAQSNVKRLFDAGVTILAGSDAPNAGTAFGVSTHHEMQLLAEAGLSSTDALKSATYLAAEHFGLQGRGRISQGMRADLTLIEGDPEQDITATLNIKHVFKNGFEIQRELSVKPTSSAPESGVLGDFESSDLDTITGFSWSATDDSMANGKSVASIAHANVNSGALQVTTEIKPDFAFPWAGAAVGDFEPPIDGLNIADYSTLSFRIKGTPGEYRAMVFSAVSSGIPPSQAFQVTEEWQTITLKLTDFVGFEQSAFSGFAFVSGPSIGKFNFVLDDVKLR